MSTDSEAWWTEGWCAARPQEGITGLLNVNSYLTGREVSRGLPRQAAGQWQTAPGISPCDSKSGALCTSPCRTVSFPGTNLLLNLTSSWVPSTREAQSHSLSSALSKLGGIFSFWDATLQKGSWPTCVHVEKRKSHVRDMETLIY